MSPNPSFYEIKVAPVAKLENGYTRIANELLNVFADGRLTYRQLRVMTGVARFTYGYSKRTALIPTKKIADYCKMQPCHARQAIADLIAAKILFREGGQKGEIGINNHMDEWTFVAGSKPIGGTEPPADTATDLLPNRIQTFATESVANSVTESVANSVTESVANQPSTPFSIKKNLKEKEKESEKSPSYPPENFVGSAELIAAAWNLERPDLAITPTLPPKRRERILKTLEFVESNVGLDDRWPNDKETIQTWFAAVFRYARNHQGFLRDRDFDFFMDPDRLSLVAEQGRVYEPRQ